ncbi:hypothetical protein [Labilibacter marinus]|uniref:hypothetical protein n=1 Tax=Labilibacter marinus TaxID=1477105 RepID=UPI00082BC784|nr:hypothetical protein [Labilibacter marinus]
MTFDKERRLNQLFADFKRTDQFYAKFKSEFEELIFDIILDYYPHFSQKDILEEMIGIYASEVLSATESVIDKDKNYPDFRKEEELGYLNRLLTKEKAMVTESEFSDTIHLKVKEIAVMHYPAISDLSTHGFRLLERNMKMHLYRFTSEFISFVK